MRGRGSPTRFIKNRASLALTAGSGVAIGEAVIRESRAVSMKSVVATLQSLQKIGQGNDIHVAGLLQAGEPVIEIGRGVHLQRCIGTKCGIDPEAQFRSI